MPLKPSCRLEFAGAAEAKLPGNREEYRELGRSMPEGCAGNPPNSAIHEFLFSKIELRSGKYQELNRELRRSKGHPRAATVWRWGQDKRRSEISVSLIFPFQSPFPMMVPSPSPLTTSPHGDAAWLRDNKHVAFPRYRTGQRWRNHRRW